MKENKCVNSSSQIFGSVFFDEDQIIIKHNNKPELIISDTDLIKKIEAKDESCFLTLYDDYSLLIGEIAALYFKPYSYVNKKIKTLPVLSKPHSGRRNSSYGQQFTEERRRKIGEKSKGRIIPQYERTPEIREKISKSLKEYYQNHEVSQETREKLSQAWKDGKYTDSPMGRGVQGYFFSKKNNKDFYFRSLLELKYLIQLEEDNTVKTFQIEPFSIKLENNHHYTPDFLINNHDIVELKSRKFVAVSDTKERFEQEQNAGIQYANEHNMTYTVIYDDELDFESKKYKRYIRDNNWIIDKYNIRFNKDIKDWSF